jgi:hypothetical protein
VSKDDFEIVRRWYLALEDEPEFVQLTHPDIEWAPFEENHTVHHGLQEAKRVVAGWSESWSFYSGEVEEVIDAGEEGIVLVLHVTARGVTSSVDVDVCVDPHFKTREGKVVYLYEHVVLADALKAAGVEA